MKKNTGSANTPSFRWKTSKNPSAHGSTETYFAVTVIDRETGRNRYPGSDIKTVSRNPHPGNTIPLLRKTPYSFLSQQVRISSRRVLPVWPQSPSPARQKSRRPFQRSGRKPFQIQKTTKQVGSAHQSRQQVAISRYSPVSSRRNRNGHPPAGTNLHEKTA